jgi:hypothetical protein
MTAMTGSQFNRRASFRRRRQALAEAMEMRILFSSIPAPLLQADIGTPTRGSSSFTAGTFTITGAGAGFAGVSDAGNFVYEPLTADGTVTVRILSSTAPKDGALAGLDIRSSLSPKAPNLLLATRADGSLFVNGRPADRAPNVNINPGVSGALPEFLQIQRSGDNIHASVSTDGINYTLLGASTIDLPATALVGMAVSSSKVPNKLATATFDGFAVTPNPTPLAWVTSAPTIGGPNPNPYRFTVTYAEPDFLVNTTTLGNNNLRIIGPDGYSQNATLVSTGLTNSLVVNAVYEAASLPTIGVYQITLNSNQVANGLNIFIPGGVIGSFNVISGIPNTIPPTATVSIAATKSQAYDINPDTSGRGQFTISRTGSTAQALEVDCAVSSQSTASASRYQPLPTSVIIAAGQRSVSFPVHPVFDNEPLPTQTLVLSLGSSPGYLINPSHASAVVRISDKAPTVSIIASKPHASEKNPTTTGLGQFTVRRTGSVSTGLPVFYYVDPSSTARKGLDFSGLEGPVTIPKGRSSAVINITPIADHLLEPTRSLTLDLDVGSYFPSPKQSHATLTIADDGSSQIPRIPVVDIADIADASEADPSVPGEFLVTRIGPTTNDLTVNYTVSGSALPGTDYIALSGTVVIPAGQSSATIDVIPLGDHTDEDVRVLVTLSNSAEPNKYLTTAVVILAKNPVAV